MLKNGRRIVAVNVVEENGRVSYETTAGRLSLPRSIVERVERNGASAPDSSAQLPLPPPPMEAGAGDDEVAGTTVRDGSIDRDFIARLEEAARRWSHN